MAGAGGAAPHDSSAGAGERGGTTRTGWPPSAIGAVAVCVVLVVLLALLNLLGVQVGRGPYRAEVGGTVADWFAGVATLVALPAAVLVGLRQVRAQTEAVAFERERAREADADADRRRAAEAAQAADAVELHVIVTNIVDEPDLATVRERGAVIRWRDEMRQRGWAAAVAGNPTDRWQRDGRRLATADLLGTEPSPLLPSPYRVTVSCHNGSGATVVVERWTIDLAGRQVVMDEPHAVKRGGRVVHPLRASDGSTMRFRSQDEATATVAALAVELECTDVLGRSFRREHRPGPPQEATGAG